MPEAERIAKLIQEANHYEDGWLLTFKDGSALQLWTDEGMGDHLEVLSPEEAKG